MKFKVSGKFKALVRTILVLVPLLSIALSFVTLPLEVAVPVSIALTALSFLLNRFVFTYVVFHVMPMPSEGMHTHVLGSSWITEDPATMEGLGFVIIYKYKDVAKEAFNMLKSWNYGRVIDASENITFRAVREGGGKYSIFLYPGNRLKSLQESETRAKELYGSDSHINIRVAKVYEQFCFDYSTDELKKKCIEAIPYLSELLLKVGYVENGEIQLYSKRGFRLKNFTLRDRVDPMLGEIERSIKWGNPAKKLPEINQALVKRVNQRLKENT
ncbi:hypothetical protein [Spirochaeta africana]|uniref:Uncharacterized protein n=1 Tax=Spirochaeta africana (strain ATCC 700263 / DSM 8902 / Z-7692) TaxID=889378 RepID=H9UIX7_SPIAZ|nr:hypothetical protein [Spirochaeta africana]AFG37470.1 hypothetical protein Spiaf_1407 [Spirochaeta africana DSM 8902]